MTVLITGGAGYIGSHAVLVFREAGYEVVVVDDLSTGQREALLADIPFVQGDAGDPETVREIIRAHNVTGVIHFAGSISIPESLEKPLAYYLNNTAASRNLVQACVDNGIRRFVFSSTSQVYGIPEQLPISEDSPTSPINPYGRSKLMTEWVLQDTAAAHDFKYVSLRYFNVAGADQQGRAGQRAPGLTHLIKVASEAVLGLRDRVEIFGADYDTPDGTGIRDYIHVTDLVEAHVQALRYLEQGGESQVLNCGYGQGYSVREVLDTVEEVAGRKLNIWSSPRLRNAKRVINRIA
jgi:UDP-glucose 4-epimerase